MSRGTKKGAESNLPWFSQQAMPWHGCMTLNKGRHHREILPRSTRGVAHQTHRQTMQRSPCGSGEDCHRESERNKTLSVKMVGSSKGRKSIRRQGSFVLGINARETQGRKKTESRHHSVSRALPPGYLFQPKKSQRNDGTRVPLRQGTSQREPNPVGERKGSCHD